MTTTRRLKNNKQRRYCLFQILFFSIIFVSFNTIWMEHSWSSKNTNEAQLGNNNNPIISSCKIKVSETPTNNKLSTEFHVSPYHKLSDFLQGPGLQHLQKYKHRNKHHQLKSNTTTTTTTTTTSDTTIDDVVVEAVCRLQNRFTLHFPHVMQQIYACISWWQAVASAVASASKEATSNKGYYLFSNNKNNSKMMILLSISKEVNTALQTSESNRFTRGILKYLQLVFNIQIRIEEDIEATILYYGDGGGDDDNSKKQQQQKQSWMVQPILLESMFQGSSTSTNDNNNNNNNNNITTSEENDSTTSTRRQQQQQQQQQAPYNMESPIHMETFVNGVIQHLFPKNAKNNLVDEEEDEVQCTTSDNNNNNNHRVQQQQQQQQQQQRILPPPRIGILNRHNTRSILNVNELVERIQNEIVLQPKTTKLLKLNVSVVYFESQPFEDQVEFFAKTDILLSPHGAQLTGIPFMYKNNNRHCNNINNAEAIEAIEATTTTTTSSNSNNNKNSHRRSSRNTFLLEFLPKRYFVPEYFGSLANLANINYNYIYLSNVQDPYVEKKQIQSMTFREQNLRKTIRNKNYCLPLDMVINSIQNMVDKYYYFLDN